VKLIKKDLCVNCGYLHWDVSDRRDDLGYTIRRTELGEYWRNRISNGEKFEGISQEVEELFKISCLRNQWLFAKSIPASKDIQYADIKSLASKRKCLYFTKYEPGYGPEEHKEIQVREKDRRIIFKATIIGAVIGALAAIFAQIFYVIITG